MTQRSFRYLGVSSRKQIRDLSLPWGLRVLGHPPLKSSPFMRLTSESAYQICTRLDSRWRKGAAAQPFPKKVISSTLEAFEDARQKEWEIPTSCCPTQSSVLDIRISSAARIIWNVPSSESRGGSFNPVSLLQVLQWNEADVQASGPLVHFQHSVLAIIMEASRGLLRLIPP